MVLYDFAEWNFTLKESLTDEYPIDSRMRKGPNTPLILKNIDVKNQNKLEFAIHDDGFQILRESSNVP